MKKLRRLLIGLFLGILICSLLPAIPASAATLYESYSTGYNIDVNVFRNVWRAQTFTPSVPHKITSVKLYIARTGLPGTTTVSIRETDVDGHPTGADLCSGTTDGDTLPTSFPFEWREITLGAGFNLDADTKYAIVVRAPTGDSTNKVVWGADNSDPTYAGGNLEASYNDGGSWSSDTGDDFMFEEWGDAVVAPTVTTNAATYVAKTTARLNSTLVDDGNEDCTIQFQYYTGAGTWTDNETGFVGEYVSGNTPWVDVDSLVAETLYHFRVQANNSLGTTSGDSVDFTTTAGVSAPTNFKAFPSATIVGLTWTKGTGATDTMIRYSETDYPADETEGALAYFGPLANYSLTGLTSGHTYYIMAISKSGAEYSDTTAEVMATTTAGEAVGEEPDDPTMPPTWFQSPDYTVLSGIPFYDQVNDIYDTYEVPRASGWFLSTILGCIVFGILVFAISKNPMPTAIALSVALSTASLVKLLPLYMMAFTVIFIIGAWQLSSRKTI